MRCRGTAGRRPGVAVLEVGFEVDGGTGSANGSQAGEAGLDDANLADFEFPTTRGEAPRVPPRGHLVDRLLRGAAWDRGCWEGLLLGGYLGAVWRLLGTPKEQRIRSKAFPSLAGCRIWPHEEPLTHPFISGPGCCPRRRLICDFDSRTVPSLPWLRSAD